MTVPIEEFTNIITTAALFNVFIVWIVSGVTLFTGRQILTLKFIHRALRSTGFFWLLTSALWFVVGLRLVFAWMGNFQMDRALFIVGQAIVVLSLAPLALYVAWKATGKYHIGKAIFFLYVLAGVTFIVLLGIFGIDNFVATPWGTKYTPSLYPAALFGFLEMTIVFFIFYLFLAQFVQRIRGQKFDKGALLLHLSLLIYGVGGYFDSQAIASGWELIVIRSLYIAAAILAYTSSLYFSENEASRLKDYH